MPACQYALVYGYQIKDAFGVYSNLPAFITESSKTFTVVSNNFAHGGLYRVAVIAAVPAGYPAFQDELLINLAMNNGCSQDVVTTTSPAIPSLTYTMTQTGLKTWSPTWTSSVAGCPLTYEIARIVNSAPQLLTSHETAALTHSTVDGSL